MLHRLDPNKFEHVTYTEVENVTRARVIALPGGHFLRNDDTLLIATLLRALRGVDPTILG